MSRSLVSLLRTDRRALRRGAAALAIATSLAVCAIAPLAPTTAEAQRVVVRPPQRGGGGGGGARGGAVVVTPEAPRRGGAVVVTPPPRGGAVVVTPEAPRRGGAVVVTPEAPRRGGAVVVTPPRTGGAVVVTPEPRRGGAVVVTPPRSGGAVVVGPQPPPPPRVVVRTPPRAVRVMAPPPPRRARVWVAPRSAGEVWVEGYWAWNGADWAWVDGHWELPPEPGAIWIGPQTTGGEWVAGYWTRPSWSAPTIPGASAAARPYQVGAYVTGLLSMQDARDASGGYYHDYYLAMQPGESATFLAVAGPSDRIPGQRVPLGMQVLWNGTMMAADEGSSGGYDARVVFTAPRAGVYVVRVRSRAGAAGTGTYVLESAQGAWAPEYDPYAQLWGGGGVQVQPQPQPGWGGGAGPGEVVAVGIGSTVNGVLQPGDRVDETRGLYDELVLDVAPGQTFTIVARGGSTLSGRTTMDVLLRVLVNGAEVARDDDSAGGRNARLVLSAPGGGRISILVGTWQGSMERDGYYTLLVLPGNQPDAQ